MRVLRIAEVGAGPPELIEVAEPSAGPGELVLRVQAVALASDAALAMARSRGEPLIPTYGPSGFVTEVGPGVTAFQPGDRVVVPFAWPRGLIQEGRRRALLERRRARWSRLEPAGLAESVRVPADFLEAELVRRLPKSLGTVEAAYLGPLAEITTALTELGLGIGDRLLIAGLDGPGLMAVQRAAALGAETIDVTDDSAPRRALAESFGARVVSLDDLASGAAESAARTSGGYDRILIMRPRLAWIEFGLRSLAEGGALMLPEPTPGELRLELDLALLARRGGGILTHSGADERGRGEAFELLRRKAIDLEGLRYDLIECDRSEAHVAALTSLDEPSRTGTILFPNGRRARESRRFENRPGI